MATADINLGHFNTDSLDRIRFSITKDEVDWVGIDSVEFVFEKPDRDSNGNGTKVSYDAIEETPGSNIWYADVTFDIPGPWSLNVRVQDGSIYKRYPFAIDLEVHDYP